MMQRGPPPEKKGDIRGFFHTFGIHWDPGSVAFDAYNPHPDIPAQQEWIFVGAQSGASSAFNPDEPITAGLQELLIWFGGVVRPFEEPSPAHDLAFTPLLLTTRESGTLDQRALFRRDMFGRTTLAPNRPHRPSGEELVLACRMRGTMLPTQAGEDATKSKVDLIFIPDLDMINLPFLWHFRRQGNEDFSFDNVTFLLNCVDALVGEDSFIELRKRRPRDRTLTAIEARETVYRDAWREEKEAAEAGAAAQMEGAQARLDGAVARIKAQEGLDDRAKAIRIDSVRKVEQRRLDASTTSIEDEKQRRIDRAKGIMNASIASIQNRYRFLAVLLSPIPAILSGLFVFLLRRKRERITVPAARTVEGGAR